MDRPLGRTAFLNRALQQPRRARAAAAATPPPTATRDALGPPNWFPGDNPPMPEIVAHGRRPDVRACALGHYPNGKGRAENAPIAGYPVSYFIQQMNDFRNGNRKSADPRK